MNKQGFVRNSEGVFSNDIAPIDFKYVTTEDAKDAVLATDYFLDVIHQLDLGCVIGFKSSDSEHVLCSVSAISDTSVSVTEVINQDPADGSIGTTELQDKAINSQKLSTDSITTAEIKDGSVTGHTDGVNVSKLNPVIRQNRVRSTEDKATSPFTNTIISAWIADGDIGLAQVAEDKSTGANALKVMNVSVQQGSATIEYNKNPTNNSKVNFLLMSEPIVNN